MDEIVAGGHVTQVEPVQLDSMQEDLLLALRKESAAAKVNLWETVDFELGIEVGHIGDLVSVSVPFATAAATVAKTWLKERGETERARIHEGAETERERIRGVQNGSGQVADPPESA